MDFAPLHRTIHMHDATHTRCTVNTPSRDEFLSMPRKSSPRKTAAIGLMIAMMVCGGTASPASAQNISIYTSTGENNCRVVSGGGPNSDGVVRACPGPAGLVVLVKEGDLRETVSVGRNRKAANEEPAAQAWFGPFSSTTTTIEWRVPDKTKPPVAMIQRWHLADIEDEGKDNRPLAKQMLAVTRLPPGAVCHVAFVDVKANPNANDLAREAADTLARDFRCGTDKVKVIGNSGRAVELALPR